MNKILSFLRVLILMLLLGPQAARAQWAEGFESDVFPPEGWTYTKVGDLKAQDGFFLDSVRDHREAMPFTMDGGKYYLKMRAYTINKTVEQVPEAWLISPELIVGEASYLRFELGAFIQANYGLRGDTLDVFVSEAGADPSDFTQRLLHVVPDSVFPNPRRQGWLDIGIDMTAYRGKTVRLAFRHRARVNAALARAYMAIDRIRFENEDSPADFRLLKLVSPVQSCNPEQKLVFEVYNAGAATTLSKVWYKHNDGEMQAVTLNQALPARSLTRVEIPDPLTLAFGQNKFTVCLESQDERAWNDTLRVGDNSDAIAMSRTADFPYIGTPETEGKDFSAAIPGRWTYTVVDGYGDENVWQSKGATSQYLVSPCMNMPAGKIRVSFDMATTGAVNFTFYRMKNGFDATKPPAESDIVGSGSASLESTGFVRKTFVLDMPEGGWQAFGILVDAAVLLKHIAVETMPGNLALTQITSPLPKLPVASGAVPVSVTLTNQGKEARSGFALCYQLGDGSVVRESYTQEVATDATVAYTFTTPVDVSEVINQTLTVWLESELEEYLADDTLRMKLKTYEAVTSPYRMSFEADEDFSVWTVDNPDRNAVVRWDTVTIAAVLPGKGQRVAAIPAFSGSPANDLLISPALNLNPGRYRISFFYAGQPYRGADMTLSVLCGRNASPSELKQTVLADFEIVQNYWLSGYASLEVKEAGLYYVGFYAQGMSADVFIDDIRIDQLQDVCIVSTAFNEKSGFNKTVAPVSVVFRNHGAEAITSVEATYVVNDGTPVTETVALDLQPGDEYTYTFNQKVDISAHKAYTLSAKVDMTDDSEPLNNTISGSAIHHYENRQLPYFEDFSQLDNRLKWEVLDKNADGNTWIPAASGAVTNDAYSGSEVLVYNSQNGVDGDDYIFSECIEVPAEEELRLSYFYKTWRNIETYKEDFTVGIYSAPRPDALVETAHRYEQVSVTGPDYEKEIHYFTPKAGQYYIGFHATSRKGNGVIYIDDIRLEKVQPKEPLYVSDFQNRAKEWDVYRPAKFFDYWQFEANPANAIHRAVLNRRYYNNAVGMLVSPAFAFEADQKVLLTFDYRMLTRTTDATQADTLDIYMGYENHPDSLHLLVARLQRTDTLSHVYTDTVQVNHDSRVYFGFKVRSWKKTDEEKTSFYLNRFMLNPVGTQTYTVSGRVVNPENEPVPDAAVVFSSDAEKQNVHTDAEGRFKFHQLFGNQSFTITIDADGYERFTQNGHLIEVDLDMGDLPLKDKAVKPLLVHAVNKGETAVVSWVKQDDLTTYRYDNGQIDNNLGLTSGTLETPMGVVHRQATTLVNVEWYLVRQETPRDYVTVFIFDLDKAGNPTDKVLYRKDNVPNTDNQWSLHELETPVECPNGFMIGLSCNGYLALACDNGQDAGYPFVDQTHYIVTPVGMQTFESQNIRRNLFLRANGVPMSDAKRFEGFEVKRFLRSDRDDESKWVTLTETPVNGSQYEDQQWKELPAGAYTYAVRSVYSSDVRSDWQFSNELICNVSNEDLTASRLVLYPNPVTAYFVVESAVPVTRYAIYNINGRRLAAAEVGNRTFRVEADAWPGGVYQIELFLENGQREVRKFVKLK